MKRFVIAGTGSGVGKTTWTIGLMQTLMNEGYIVQGFKCGPDYIDPTYHSAVTKRKSRNIDSWMLAEDVVTSIVSRASDGADIAIIEGVMGFYDGKSPLNDAGSTAEISVMTKSPVILIVNAASMARSVAAVVKGFQTLSTEPNIVAVIVNQVGSKSHYELVKAAIEQECHIPVIGYLQKNATIAIPSRHLGLIPAIERGELQDFFEQLATAIKETVNIEQLLSLVDAPALTTSTEIFEQQKSQNVRIAVAKDAAFNFYYEENLELLKARGAEVVFFSPLENEEVPLNVDGLYLGGGFPEEFAEQLHNATATKQSIKETIERGVPTLAECGGFAYLTNSITTTQGDTFEMLGLIAGDIIMQEKLAALGYREITAAHPNFLLGENDTAKGHEFHYAKWTGANGETAAYKTTGRFGQKEEGFAQDNIVAGFTHFHFASNVKLVDRWIKACKKVKK